MKDHRPRARRIPRIGRDASMIDLDLIQTGDRIAIQDRARNVARGAVTRNEATMRVNAFGLDIEFLRFNSAQCWVPRPGIAITGHQPALIGSESA